MAIRDINFNNFMMAEVRDNEDPKMEGRLKVFIPSIMFDNNFGEKPKDSSTTSVDSDYIINEDYTVSNLNKSNYIWVRSVNLVENNEASWNSSDKSYPNGGSYRVPRKGTKVLVFFLDGDPQKGYWLPFTPTVDGETIHTKNAFSSFLSPSAKPNVDTIRAYYNGNRIEFDNNNSGIFKIVSGNGLMKVSTDGAVLENGSASIILNGSNIQIGNKGSFKNGLQVMSSHLNLAHSNKIQLVVQNNYIVIDNNLVTINDNITIKNNKINITNNDTSIVVSKNDVKIEKNNEKTDTNSVINLNDTEINIENDKKGDITKINLKNNNILLETNKNDNKNKISLYNNNINIESDNIINITSNKKDININSTEGKIKISSDDVINLEAKESVNVRAKYFNIDALNYNQ